MTEIPKIILASQSQRRKELLARSGMPFAAITPDVEEIDIPDRPEDTVRINSAAKAEWGRRSYPDSVIIGADTVVFLDRIMGKPETMARARQMLMELSGRTHAVYTAVTVILPSGRDAATGVALSRVTVKELDDEVISEYFRLVNPLDKAGGYAIQEYGETLIEKCEGSFSNVIGLPMEILGEMLEKYPETRRYSEMIKKEDRDNKEY
jgi:nucleoside triphosphate pyrophosphatase